MEIEPSPPAVAKKLWNTLRILFFMLRKGIAKSKIMAEFQLMVKRGKLAGKALVNSLMLHQYSAAFSCHSHDAHLTFVSPREYEFSCSNSPAFPAFHAINKRKHHHHHHLISRFSNKPCRYDDVSTVNNAVHKVLEMLNNEKVQDVEASPLVTLPGFGKSPIGIRQLRITDSPFPLKEEGDVDRDVQVDMAAEEFIKKFYKDLNFQKTMAALESPYHNNLWWDR